MTSPRLALHSALELQIAALRNSDSPGCAPHHPDSMIGNFHCPSLQTPIPTMPSRSHDAVLFPGRRQIPISLVAPC